ncbi:hypothetical protein FD754_014982 [Muntiacus muntjak]|uniref:Shisa N-terminal domain-containing protein n=1 Tax=Muntiacus muntjak TaxID=9888 RepID=A0A5N3VP20_MUNMU|nr:hypothetical protein FD754_014982 [Muntiacus muntjak]
MRRVLRLLLGCFLTELCARVCRAQERAGHGQLAQLGGVVVLTGGNRSGAASGEVGEGVGVSDAPPTRAPTPDFCRGYFDVMGQWDPPFNCSSGDFIFCCGTCGFRFCCTFKKRRLNQSTCTNYDTPLWLNTGKPPARKDDPLHDPTKDKTNLIVYIICGVVAVMVLVGIFTKLGLEKAHRPQREHMSRALADVMRPQGHCNTDHMERDLNIVVHVQHYENMDTRTPINNLPKYTGHWKSYDQISQPRKNNHLLLLILTLDHFLLFSLCFVQTLREPAVTPRLLRNYSLLLKAHFVLKYCERVLSPPPQPPCLPVTPLNPTF